jgi:hypothetical protein
LILLATAGVLIAGAAAVRATRRARAGHAIVPAVAPPRRALPPIDPTRSDASRELTRMAAVAVLVVVLGLVGVVLTRPSDIAKGETAPALGPSAAASAFIPSAAAPASPEARLSLAACQAAIAARVTMPEELTCGYDRSKRDEVNREPAADPNDPEYAGSSLPTNLSTDGKGCSTGPGRPVLDTVRPVLTTDFIPVPGLSQIMNTFQLTRLDGNLSQDLVQAGSQMPGSPDATATLDLRGNQELSHGVTYKWRVRATPPYIAIGGWSPWCEFTIAKVTPDDLGLESGRIYTVTLPVGTWRQISALLGPVETYVNGEKSKHLPIAVAASKPAGQVPVTLDGHTWDLIVGDLASLASQEGEPWTFADVVSAALGGPPHPTMGFERK